MTDASAVKKLLQVFFLCFFLVVFFFLPGVSGSAMNVAYGEGEMKRFLEEATQVSQVSRVSHPSARKKSYSSALERTDSIKSSKK